MNSTIVEYIGGIEVIKAFNQGKTLMQSIRTEFGQIRMGRMDATDEEVEAVAKAAGCDAFIRGLEKGYDTVVGVGFLYAIFHMFQVGAIYYIIVALNEREIIKCLQWMEIR